MRLDIPLEVPRRRQSNAPELKLEPSPLEAHSGEIRHQADNRLRLNIRRNRKTPEHEHAESKQHVLNNAPRPTTIERRARRQQSPEIAIGLFLRAEERKALTDIGKFRVLATADLAATAYAGNLRALQRDLRFLQSQGFVRIDSVNARRDGRSGRTDRIEVVTLSKLGRQLVARNTGIPPEQKIYSGLVKPREVEHDTQIYRAYLKEAERIRREGGHNLRVQLDFELKAKIQKAIYAQRKQDPGLFLDEIKQEVAQRFDLPFVNGGIQIPDARIEYERGQGSTGGHQDIEVLTAAYRPGHLRNKAQAGFHLYATSSDRATLTAKIEEDHHLIDGILEL